MIRIAQIVGKMAGGGVESVVMNYYRHIDRTKVQFDFIIDDDSTVVPTEEIESLGGRIYTVPGYQKLNKYIPALVKLFKENDYKIVHSHINSLSVFPLLAARIAGVPVRIAHNHSTAAKGETKKNILKYALRPFAKVNATHYAACSICAGEWLFGERSVKNGEVKIFNNAIELEKFVYDESVRNEVRKELNVEDKFVVGHVGRFCYQKNQEFVIDVFNEIHKKEPKSVLLLIGSGKTEPDIKKQIKDLGLESAVILLGNCDDVFRKYQAMDVLLFPSRYEGLGMVAVEAQTAALKTIASTEVPQEAKIGSYLEFLNLRNTAEEWAEQALKSVKCERKNLLEQVSDSGFDIKKEAGVLVNYYEKAEKDGYNG